MTPKIHSFHQDPASRASPVANQSSSAEAPRLATDTGRRWFHARALAGDRCFQAVVLLEKLLYKGNSQDLVGVSGMFN